MGNVLVIGDTHSPFEKENYWEFCYEQKKKHKCQSVVHIGDLVDNHAVSYHEHNPNGFSPKKEILKARGKFKKISKMFPSMKICKGNHDVLFDRKAITNGIPEIAIRSFKEIYDLPAKWEYDWEHTIYNVLFTHGVGYGGKTPHITCAINKRKSVVIGHCHSRLGVDYHVNDDSIIWGMSVGCGIDRMKYAFWYGKDFKDKPAIGCGVVLENGRLPIPIPMKM